MMSSLHHAAKEGNIDKCRQLIDDGADLDLQDSDKKSPLHYAQQSGNTDVCRLLVERGADLNLQDIYWMSPLLYAAKAGDAGVCRLLFEGGADLHNQSRRHKLSALHYAAKLADPEICRLLLDGGAKSDLRDVDKRPPLHHAAEARHVGTCRVLLEKGAARDAADKDGNTALHIAAGVFRAVPPSAEMCRLLMEFKADPTIVNKDEKTAAEVTPDVALKRMIQTYEAEYRVAHLESKKPKTVRLAVLGDEAVGKSQFIRTVNSSAVGTYARSLSAPPKPGSTAYLAQRTPGIAMKKIILRHGRKLRVLDFGGQLQFIASHRPILVTRYGIYLVMVKIDVDMDAMMTSACFWITFIIATRDPLTFSGRPPPIFLVFSHADRVANPAELSSQVYCVLKEKYTKHFTWMAGNPYVCNCRLRSSEIARLLDGLSEGHTLVVEEMPEEPLLNGQIRKALKKHRQSFLSPILKLDDYCAFVRQQVCTHFQPTGKELVSLTTLLDDQADVMMFDCQGQPDDPQEVGDSFVVVNPQQMCHDMFKRILSPHNFLGSHLVFPKHGVIEETKLDEALCDASVDPFAGKALLEHSKVCTPVIRETVQATALDTAAGSAPNPEPKKYFFSIHVQHTDPPGTVLADDGRTKLQAGFQLHCPSIPVSVSYLPVLQLELSKRTGGITEKSLVWKTGMVVQEEKNVSVMVQRADDSLDVNFIARAIPDRLDDCATALGKVSKIARSTARAYTPGSEVEVRYLSPSQLTAFQPPTKLVAYTADDVIQCFNNETNIQHGVVYDYPSEIIPVVKAVEPHRSSEIRDITSDVVASISAEVTDRMTCISLALEIGVARGPLAVVEGKRDVHYTSQDCCELLHDWRKTKPEFAGAILYESLVRIGKKEIAMRHGLNPDPDVQRTCRHDLGMKKAIFKVAVELGNRSNCLALGVELDVQGEPMVRIKSMANDTKYSAGDAYDMLNAWLLSDPPEPDKILHSALKEINMLDTAEKFL